MTTPRKQHDDLAATLAARQELGPEYDAAFVEKVVERLEQTIDARMGTPVRTRSELEIAKEERKTTIAVAAISLGVAIPLTAIAAGTTGEQGLLISWIGLVLINVAYALRSARHRR